MNLYVVLSVWLNEKVGIYVLKLPNPFDTLATVIYSVVILMKEVIQMTTYELHKRALGATSLVASCLAKTNDLRRVAITENDRSKSAEIAGELSDLADTLKKTANAIADRAE